MRIITACVVLGCLITATLAADEHRPAKKKDDRGKRNLEYQIAHHYPGPQSYRLERRISTGPQHPLYPPSQFYPGPPRPYSPYRKDTSNALGRDDLLAENNQIQDKLYHEHHVYGHRKPQVIERPVYIKEPEPIIEIIIKESNVTLPPPPTTPPPKKKKEQVQVFYVKYKKNPHGTGKDSVIYDKPIPAISPKIPDDEDEDEQETSYNYHRETVTAPPPPTTTLRTIIKPDSEVYHSPSGVKVTFGKEGFDYEKRSSKPEEYTPPQQAQFPQGRQLTSFSNTYFKRPLTNQNFQSPPPSPPSFRQPQPYRPFSFPPAVSSSNFPPAPSSNNFPPAPSSNYKPLGRQTPQFPPQTQKFPPFQSPSFTKPTSQQFSNFPASRPQNPPTPQFSHTISHPPPPHFQNPRPSPPQGRQPVAYKPFDSIRPQQQSFVQQSQSHVPHLNPNPVQPQIQPQIQFRPETHFPTHQQLPLTQQSHTFNPTRITQPQINSPQQFRKEELPQSRVQSQLPPQPQQIHYQHQVNHNQFLNQQVPQNQPVQQQQPISQTEHLSNIQTVQNGLPPGGQLIQSLPRYEQHISEVQPVDQKNQGLNSQEFQQKILEQFNLKNSAVENKPQNTQSQRELLQQPQQQNIQPQHEFLQQQTQQNAQPQHELLQQQQQQLQQQILEHQRQQQQEQLRTAEEYYRQEVQQRNLQNDISHTTPRASYQATRRTTQYINNTPRITYQTTTSRPSTTTEEPEKPSTTTKDPKILEAQLPDEVPDDLREQLLSSGILNNADISILDYDKVGDIPLSALPPDQLANFYNAGGGAQIAAGSAPEPAVLHRDGTMVEERLAVTEDDQEPEASEIQEVKAAPPDGVEMKVVHYDPETDKGKDVQDSYVDEDAEQVDPVILNDNSYNRYLPLKVNGTQFPIPNVPELKGKRVSSVVVLAPVTYDFSSDRKTREAEGKITSDVDLVQGDHLKQLLANPTLENYKRFLEKENKTRSDKQAVILLVADPLDTSGKDKEIFMYDVATQTVSKLSGELSSAFVEAAEANSSDDAPDDEEAVAAASNIIETRVPFSGNIDRQDLNQEETDLAATASEYVESKVPIIDPTQDEVMETAEASERLESFVDASGIRIGPQDDLSISGSELNSNSVENQSILFGSGHKTGHS